MGQNRRARILPLVICALIFLLIAFASTVTIIKSSYADKGGFFIRPYYESSNAPVTGCTLPCLTVDTQATEPTGSGSFALPSGSSMYLWSPQFASATTISAGSWTFDFWAATVATSTYFPITLTNSQSAATPNPFQQKITFNPSSYSSYEATDLGNIRFCADSGCATQLYAWLESCTPSCGPTATSATAWVKLTSSIAANGGTLTIYLVFLSLGTEFSGPTGYWGEAPQLSSTYAQYDNGANVFNFYDNFAGTGGPSTASWTTSSYGTGATYATDNELMITCGAHSAYNAAVVEKTALTAPEVAEADIVSQTGNEFTDLGVGSGWDATANGVANNGYTISWNGQTGTQFDRIWVDNAGTRTMVDTTAAGSITSLPAGVWTMSWYATGHEAANDGVGNPGSFTETNSVVSLPASYVMVIGEASSSGASGTVDVQWARMRATPPSNVMPSFAQGGITSNLASVSVYITGATGAVVATVASNIESPPLGTTKTECVMTFAGAQASVQAGDYISVVIAVLSGTTVYWGAGQPTNFQVSFTYRT